MYQKIARVDPVDQEGSLSDFKEERFSLLQLVNCFDSTLAIFEDPIPGPRVSVSAY
jgi:hypothetical protein